jgi:hypothetical protein
VNRYAYGERDYAFGQLIKALRSTMNRSTEDSTKAAFSPQNPWKKGRTP